MATGTRLRYNLASGTIASGITNDVQDSALNDTLTNLELNTNTADFEMGWAFDANTDFALTGLRIYHASSVSRTLKLWDNAGQTVIDSVAVDAVPDQWVEVSFSAPVNLTNGTRYVISVNKLTENIYYIDSANAAAQIARGDLITLVEGRINATPGTFPDQTDGTRLQGVVDMMLDVVGTSTIDFGTDPGFATIGVDEYIPLVVGDTNATREIVHLYNYTSGATTGTVERAREGTAPSDHVAGTLWFNGPTTQDFDVTELDNYVDPNTAASTEVSTHVGATDPHSDRAYTDTQDAAHVTALHDGGTLLTDAAADPINADGTAGDFHLRRDTGVLTGPKFVQGVALDERTAIPSNTSHGFTSAYRWASPFLAGATVEITDFTFHTEAITSAGSFGYLLDASRNILATSDQISIAPGVNEAVFSTPPTITSGQTYYIAVESGTTSGRISGTTVDPDIYPDATIIQDPGNGGAILTWTSQNAGSFADAPDQNSTGSIYEFTISTFDPSAETWTGADSILLASRDLTVEDVGTATYTVAADDTGKVKRFTVDATVDLPDSLPVGTVVELMAFGANGLTVQAGGTATVYNAGSIVQYATCSALCVATDVWTVVGAEPPTPIELGMAASDESTAISTTGTKTTFRMPHAMTVNEVRASLNTACTTGTFTVDVNEGGVSIFSTTLTIDATEKTSTTAATAAVISDGALADDAEITIDVDNVGDGTATGLKVWLLGTRA